MGTTPCNSFLTGTAYFWSIYEGSAIVNGQKTYFWFYTLELLITPQSNSNLQYLTVSLRAPKTYHQQGAFFAPQPTTGTTSVTQTISESLKGTLSASDPSIIWDHGESQTTTYTLPATSIKTTVSPDNMGTSKVEFNFSNNMNQQQYLFIQAVLETTTKTMEYTLGNLFNDLMITIQAKTDILNNAYLTSPTLGGIEGIYPAFALPVSIIAPSTNGIPNGSNGLIQKQNDCSPGKATDFSFSGYDPNTLYIFF